MTHARWIEDFVRESNRIEGIFRDPSKEEIDKLVQFIYSGPVAIGDLEAFIHVNAPGNTIRDKSGSDVMVGDYVAPAGGPDLRIALNELLMTCHLVSAWELHVAYEMLHPFTDGNGRSGRALWLWHLTQFNPREAHRAQKLGFLHTFYYQTLAKQGSKK